MTLAFFDFYPVVGRSSTFGDLLNQAGYYFMFEGSNLLVLVAFFILSFTPIARAFNRKHMVFSVALALTIMLVLALIEKSLLIMRLSNILLDVAYNFVTIVICYFMLFLIPYFTRERHTELETIAKLRALPVIAQVIFLALLFVSCCAYRHAVYIPLVILTFLLGVFLLSKSNRLRPVTLQYSLTDGIPLLIVGFIGFVLSYVKVGTVVCNIPIINEYFSCPNY